MNRIASLRKEHGLSQVEMARALHIAQNTLSQYETERRHPTIRVISAIAEMFDVSENYVLGIDDTQDGHDSEAGGITEVKAIKIFTDDQADEINFYLRVGWRLLHIGNVSNDGYSYIQYTLGWYGSIDAIETFEFENKGYEYYPEAGGIGGYGEGIEE